MDDHEQCDICSQYLVKFGAGGASLDSQRRICLMCWNTGWVLSDPDIRNMNQRMELRRRLKDQPEFRKIVRDTSLTRQVTEVLTKLEQ